MAVKLALFLATASLSPPAKRSPKQMPTLGSTPREPRPHVRCACPFHLISSSSPSSRIEIPSAFSQAAPAHHNPNSSHVLRSTRVTRNIRGADLAGESVKASIVKPVARERSDVHSSGIQKFHETDHKNQATRRKRKGGRGQNDSTEHNRVE